MFSKLANSLQNNKMVHPNSGWTLSIGFEFTAIDDDTDAGLTEVSKGIFDSTGNVKGREFLSGCISLYQASRISRPLDVALTICDCGPRSQNVNA